MNETYVSSTKLGMILAWTAVGALMAGAWGVILVTPEHWKMAGLLATSACVTSAVAATLSIKIYAARQCALIRALSGLDGGDAAGANVLSLR